MTFSLSGAKAESNEILCKDLREEAKPGGKVTLRDCETSTTSIKLSAAFRIYKGKQGIHWRMQQPIVQVSLE